MRDLEIVAAVALVVVNIRVPSLLCGFERSREDLKEEVRSCPWPFPVAGSGRGEGGVGVELEGREVAIDAAFDGVEFGVGAGLDDAALVDDEDAVGVADGGKDGAVTGICLRLLTVLRQAFLWSSRGLGIDSDSDPDTEGFPQGRGGAGNKGRGCRCCEAPPRSLRALADSRELPFVLARLRAKPRGREGGFKAEVCCRNPASRWHFGSARHSSALDPLLPRGLKLLQWPRLPPPGGASGSQSYARGRAP